VFSTKAVSRRPFNLFRRQSSKPTSTTEEAVAEEAPVVAEPAEERSQLLKLFVAAVQDYDAHYCVTETVWDRASQLKEGHPDTVDAVLTRAQDTYQTMKAVLPESYQKQVATIEGELLTMDAAKFDCHVDRLDCKINDTYVHLEGAAKGYVNGAIDKASTSAESGLRYAEDSLDYVLAPSGETDSDEAIDGLDLNAPVKADSTALQTEKLHVVAHKAARLSKKAQKRLQKRVMRGMSDLKLRQGNLLDAVDLIQYNRFLDVDAVRKQAGEATKVVGDVITTQLDVVDGMVVQPARQLTEKAAGVVQNQVVQPAKEFYTVVVVEFLNNPTQTAQEFLQTMQTQLGSEWSSQLEEPTERLRARLAVTWGHVKEIGLDYRESVEVTVLDMVEKLQKGWDELPFADRAALATAYGSYFAVFATGTDPAVEVEAVEEPAVVADPAEAEKPAVETPEARVRRKSSFEIFKRGPKASPKKIPVTN